MANGKNKHFPKHNNQTQIKQQQVQQQITATTWSSPIPPPEILAGYENALPGTAQIIVDIMKIEGEHRRKMEVDSLGIEIAESKNRRFNLTLSVIVASTMVVVPMFFAAFMTYIGRPTEAITAFITGVGLLIWGKYDKKSSE